MTRAVALAASLAIGGSCGDSTSPLVSDVQTARSVWLSSRPANYSFEISNWSDWFPQSQFYTVTVENGVAVSLRDEAGDEVPHTMIPSIEDHWQRILDAKENGTLQHAVFGLNGVPAEWSIDNEAWADDAWGATIRSFRKR